MPYIMLVTFVVLVACLIDIILTDNTRVRNLPKPLWILLVIFLPLAGSVVWLVAGRPYSDDAPRRTTGFPEYERPGRHIAQRAEDDDEFLRQCRARAEEQRRRYKQQNKDDNPAS
ncbi:PLDc_N domain-containing protein [Hoyosella rhizosphaerae]|uniref:Membrane protein n=1 Tax=Hoyosella rhizosphaerae TaxID=1755582 RepID=A0A916XCC2_9ACTN|nr:PLD nuclease N-terminal domain-containing protein [Hoyosella rhizosphaerae]MBN4927558.1 PLDc_N domain-containing protein [Hoyosella rhizosphaerae]GGC63509.1 membrane protein [Hoyosella rhizosphaerae]